MQLKSCKYIRPIFDGGRPQPTSNALRRIFVSVVCAFELKIRENNNNKSSINYALSCQRQ